MMKSVKHLTAPLIACAIAAIAAIFPAKAMSQQSNNVPDFAFPAKVQKNAETRYSAAMKTSDYISALRALMDMTLAQTAVDPDSLGGAIDRVESFAAQSRGSVASSAACLLAARMLYDSYSSDRYVYDRREMPALPLPADITQWSGAQYRSRITALCDSALADIALLKATPLPQLKQIVSITADAAPFYPTAYDFIARRCIELRVRISDSAERLPLTALCPAENLGATAATLERTRPSAAAILKIYASLLEFHAADAAPFISADIARIDFTKRRLYPSISEKGEEISSKLLWKLAARFDRSMYSCLPLLSIARNCDPFTPQGAEIYSALKAASIRFKTYPAIACVKNRLAEMAAKSVETSNNSMVAPGGTLKVKVTAANTNTATITLYRLPDSPLDFDDYSELTAKAVNIARRSVSFAGAVPFRRDTTVSFTLPDCGRYLVVPSIAGVADARRSYPIVRVSALCAGIMTFEKRQVLVVDPVSGAPVSGADIMAGNRGRRPAIESRIGATDADGFLTLSPDISGNIRPVKGADRYAWPVYSYRNGERATRIASVSLYTDLAIYHPGDSIQWAAIAYKADGLRRSPMASQRLRVVLRDANYTAIDTIYASTDAHGRTRGSFEITSGLLTGNYTIQAAAEGNDLNASGSIRVMVSDYKLPTYYAEITSVVRDTPGAGCVTLRGKAVTYAGVPLAGIDVEMKLSSLPMWWWRAATGDDFYTAKTVTDASGCFEFIITSADFALAPNEEGAFAANITTTSATGENSTASRIFTRGDAYRIAATIPSDIDISEPVKLDITVLDGENNPAALPVKYELIADTTVVASGIVNPRQPVNLTGVKSGIYTLSLSLPDKKAESFSVENIALYRPTDKMPPRNTPVWVPVSKVFSGDTLLYGTSAAQAHVLYTAWTPGRIIEQKWLRCEPGIHSIIPTLPDNADEMTITLMSVSDYTTATADIKVSPKTPRSGLQIFAESWRDKIVPGTAETWRFRVETADSAGAEAAVMLDMYNAALDKFATPQFSLYARSGYVPFFHLNAPYPGRTSYASVSPSVRYLRCPSDEAYGRSFAGRNTVRYRTFTTSARSVDDAGAVVEDMVMVRNEAKMAMMSSADTEEAADEAAPAAGAAAPDESAEATPFAYRTSSVPLAFFEPMLTTDKDGMLSYTFTVPNANATWALKALAFTDRIESAVFSGTTVASKPVMVTPNMPRFVRTGDTVAIMAEVFNNTDSSAVITTVTELFAPATGKILSTQTRTNEIAANSSATVTDTLNAPTDVPFVGYRIKSSSTSFADGEQSLIPVLPSSTPVYESTTFYLPANDTKFDGTLPATTADSRTYLTYCDNPLWYVVAALPGLRSGDNGSAIKAAQAIYSVATAQGLLTKYPAIGEALKQWSTSDRSDSTLVAMLSRNSDMKTLLLQATPWMLDATSDTERMQRLSLLFDEKECAASLNEAVSTLEKLQSAGGGIAWISLTGEPSLWATAEVLTTIGQLNTFGFMPSDKRLAKVCAAAFEYLQREYSSIFAKYPDSDFATYSTVCSLWPGFKPSSIGTSMISRHVQRVVATWKDMDTSGKARAALLLKRLGHGAVAANIVSSLGEFAVSSPERGMWWPSLAERSSSLSQLTSTAAILEAYALITPQTPQIEQIRQWLILQKETTSWGSGADATAITTAILASSGKWIAPAGKTSFSLNGKKLTADAAPFTGEIKLTLPQLKRDSRLSIVREVPSPAWGAVTSIDIRPMQSVEAASCPQLSIEKTILADNGNGWEPAKSFSIGSKVKVQLIVKAQQPIDYLAITDDRAACLEPVEQLPAPMWQDGICFYRENRDAATNIFVSRLPKGTFVLEYEMWVNNAGVFSSGIATAQSQYAPQITAHSAGKIITSDPKK